MDSFEGKIVLMNPERKPLTPDKLRELSGLKLTDGEAAEIICSIDLYVKVLYEAIATRKPFQDVASLNGNNHPKAA